MPIFQLKSGFEIYFADVFFNRKTPSINIAKREAQKAYTRIAALNEEDAYQKALDVYDVDGSVKKIILNRSREQNPNRFSQPENIIGIAQAIQ